MEIRDLTQELDTVEVYSPGRLAWNRIGMSTAIHAMRESGGQEFLNLLWKHEFPFIKTQCERVIEKYGIQGETASAANLVQLALIWGFGYDWHVPNVTREHHIEAYGLWCPLVQAAHEMGIQEGSDLMPNWCDMFSTQIGKAVADNIFVCHAYCPTRGDRMCRTAFVELESDPLFDEDHIYQEVVRLKKAVRGKLTPTPVEDAAEPLPPFFDSFLPESIAREAVELLGRCTCHIVLTAAKLMGWDKFLSLVNEKQTYGYKYAAMKQRADFFAQGSELSDAASMLMFNYESMGFFGREVACKSPDRIIITGGRCPMAEAAGDCGPDQATCDASRWCDYYHNNTVKLFNNAFSCLHTRCPLKGDAECRVELYGEK